MQTFKRLIILCLAAIPMALAASGGCGVVIDMAKDNEWRFASFGGVDFISPVKLRVGVLPFSDEVGMGALETGSNLSRLMSEEFSKDKRLEVVSPEQVQQAMAARGYYGTLSPQQAAEVGTDLNLNAVVLGSLSEMRKYNVRKGWRRIARIVTAQREYVDAVLAVSAVDTQTGIVLVSRANVGEYDAGSGNKDFFEAGDRTGNAPEQEAIEGSLDEALRESYHRTMQGLATLPFKARVLAYSGGEVTIGFGKDVGLSRGQKFVKLEISNVITNTIGDTYQIMGAPVARLKVISVGDNTATLELEEGFLSPGDIIQAQ